jgi:transposase-like protein
VINREQARVVRKITELLRIAAAPWCINGHGRMKGVGRHFYCSVCEPLEDNPWCVQCRKWTKAHGVTRDTVQRWMCNWCSGSFLGSRESKSVSVGAYPDTVRKISELDQSIPLFRAGRSIREVMRIVGISNATANKFRRLALRDFDARCGCGQEAGHRGWCSYRYRQHPKRQEFMKRWHGD